MRRHASGLAALLPPLLLLALSACEPGAGSGVTARLLTDGTGVLHNGRRAVSGDRLRPGDNVRTGFGGAALVEFSDGTKVEIVEAQEPVYLSWSGDKLDIRMQGTIVEYLSGAVFKVVDMITDLATVFNESHFIAARDQGGSYRHLLFTGRARMIFPEPGLPIFPGQYALVTPAGEVSVRPIPAALERDLRSRLDRWRFIAPRSPEVPRIGAPAIGLPGSQIFGPRWPGSRRRVPRSSDDSVSYPDPLF